MEAIKSRARRRATEFDFADGIILFTIKNSFSVVYYIANALICTNIFSFTDNEDDDKEFDTDNFVGPKNTGRGQIFINTNINKNT